MVKSNVFFEALFNRDISSPGTKEFLATITEEHPYFIPARFFLLKQTAKNTDDFKKELSKSAVFFNNNYWLNYLLQVTDETTIKEEIDIYTTKEEIDKEEEDDSSIVDIEESIAAPSAYNNEQLTEETASSITEDEVLIDNKNETVVEQEEIPAAENTTAYNNYESTETEIETETEIRNDELVIENNNQNISEQEEIPAAENVTVYEEEEKTEVQTAAAENVPAEEKSDDELFTVPSFHKLNIADDAKSDVTEGTLIFEPLHTTDYFASVGIKLGNDLKPADKLGHQLKSFTDWLKTMKKVHSVPQLETTQEAEQKIQVLAEKSNVNGDVMTEAMADVLAQQGRTDQAVDMLEKLSLLNPLKSAYFAAKIKNLKEQ